jgi:SAM-dependent methyltransferase
MRNVVLRGQAWLKEAVKPLLFRDETVVRTVRFGAGRGLSMRLNRRHELQKELGLWEFEAQGIYRRWVSSGCTVYDVGAGDGDSALLLARLAAPGKVVAFEPVSELRDRLAANAALNPDVPVPVVVPAFVGDRVADGHTTLDAVAAGRSVPPPDFVKIDVDGAELAVLEGMWTLLSTVRPVVFLEVHGMDRERACHQFLEARGYAVRVIRNAWWRTFYPEHRLPAGHNRWLLACPKPDAAMALT